VLSLGAVGKVTAKGSPPRLPPGFAARSGAAALRGLCALGAGAAKGSADVSMAKGSGSALRGVGARGRGPAAFFGKAAPNPCVRIWRLPRRRFSSNVVSLHKGARLP
jgi:hypothetical protein